MAANEGRTETASRKVVCRRMLVSGIVQGVGFRPFVYRIASASGVAGTVANTSEGVRIIIEGEPRQIDAFLEAFDRELPPLAMVTSRKIEEAQPQFVRGFAILPSTDDSAHEALIPPDVSVCHNCLREMSDPADRRYAYPFINCTDCGPRYTIITDVPYDREKTSMRDFPMCPDCRREYETPSDRRFHAEATCCPACGPALFLFDNARRPIDAADPIAFAREALRAGAIVAVKGIGGFHLAVDALNAAAVEELRRRKGRGLKPFALMADSVEKVRSFCIVSDGEAELLASSIRPIVLLRKRPPGPAVAPIAGGVAPHNGCFGVMLPYTPLHRLLLGDDFTALVMTSGNLADEPIVIDDDAAFERLGHAADFFLTHNRRIIYRADDSLIKLITNGASERPAPQMWRRSRGYAPRPMPLFDQPPPPILACGALMKNTIALTRGSDVFVSQHLGDTDTADGIAFFEQTIEHLEQMLGIRPEVIAHDLHPHYATTRYAQSSPIETKIGVQHHHAHIASVQCEHRIMETDVIGFALDGTGYGLDGTVWGGEVLVGRPAGYERVAHIECVPMPGGERAIEQPWRMAISHLLNAVGPGYRSLPLPFLETHAGLIDDVEKLASRPAYSPMTSSCGRLFDAVSAMLGLCERATFEGEPAARLEAAAAVGDAAPYGYELARRADGPAIISIKRTISEIAADIAAAAPPEVIAARFHTTLIEAFAEAAAGIRRQRGITAVVLGGGVFLNEILLAGLTARLRGLGFDVYTAQLVPPGDGGIGLGQAAIAAAMCTRR